MGIEGNSPLVLTQLPVGDPQALECHSFPLTVMHRALDGQGLLIEGNSPLVLPQCPIDAPQVIEGKPFRRPISYLPVDREGLLIYLIWSEIELF